MRGPQHRTAALFQNEEKQHRWYTKNTWTLASASSDPYFLLSETPCLAMSHALDLFSPKSQHRAVPSPYYVRMGQVLQVSDAVIRRLSDGVGQNACEPL